MKTALATEPPFGELLAVFRAMTVDELRDFLAAFEALFVERMAV